jgi:hypothetical protein
MVKMLPAEVDINTVWPQRLINSRQIRFVWAIELRARRFRCGHRRVPYRQWTRGTE